jgi:hypothetical protein
MVTLVDRKVRKDERKKRDKEGERNDRNDEWIFITHELCIRCEWVQSNRSKHFTQNAASQACWQPLKPYSHSIPKNVACLYSTRASLQSRARYARMGGQTGSTTPFHIYSAIVDEWTTASLHQLHQVTSPHLTSTDKRMPVIRLGSVLLWTKN